MQQTYHTDYEKWPLPLGAGVLVEVDFAEVKTELALPGGSLFNLSTARVRATSPHLPEQYADLVLPEGNGSFGLRVLVSEPNMRYLQDAEYQACGIDVPDPDVNGLGDLAFISFERIIGLMKDQEIHADLGASTSDQLPFIPMGGRVFFEYDFDDDSTDEHKTDGGIILQEKTIAAENQMATVIGCGPNTQFLGTGDRVIVKRHASSITFEGTDYFFAEDESEIFAVLRHE